MSCGASERRGEELCIHGAHSHPSVSAVTAFQSFSTAITLSILMVDLQGESEIKLKSEGGGQGTRKDGLMK